MSGGGESSRSLTAACSCNRSILLLVIVANLLLQLIYKLNFIAGMYKWENPVGTGSLLPAATGLAGGRGAFPAHKTGLLHSDTPTCLAPRPASHPDPPRTPTATHRCSCSPFVTALTTEMHLF